MIAELLDRIEEHPDFVITEYMGSTVLDLELVRKNLRPISSEYVVVKNSIARVALDKLKLEEAKALIDGGIGISLSGKDIIATCKVLVNFTKDHEKFKIKGAVIDGKLVPATKVKELASLPSKEALLAQVVGTMKAPITGFVMVLGGVLRKFIYAINAVKEKKEKEPQPQAPAAEQPKPEAAEAAKPQAAEGPSTELGASAKPETNPSTELGAGTPPSA